jgi:hypothetical protein
VRTLSEAYRLQLQFDVTYNVAEGELPSTDAQDCRSGNRTVSNLGPCEPVGRDIRTRRLMHAREMPAGLQVTIAPIEPGGRSRCPPFPDSPRLFERPHQFIVNLIEVDSDHAARPTHAVAGKFTVGNEPSARSCR